MSCMHLILVSFGTLVSNITQSGLWLHLGTSGHLVVFPMVSAISLLAILPVDLWQGWCSGMISDIWHLDEHTPNVLECLTYWIASAMGRSRTYQRPKVGCIDSSDPRHINRPAQLSDVAYQGHGVFSALSEMSAWLITGYTYVPEPLNAPRIEILLPIIQADIAALVVSGFNWEGKSQGMLYNGLERIFYMVIGSKTQACLLIWPRCQLFYPIKVQRTVQRHLLRRIYINR